MNRKWRPASITEFYEWGKIIKTYRDKTGCIIYVSDNYLDVYVDIPNDGDMISSDESVSSGVNCYGHTPLAYMMMIYLKITKIWLRKNKVARRWLNRVVKNKLFFEGRPFKDYFFSDGQVNWKLVAETARLSPSDLLFLSYDVDWEGYDPFRNYPEVYEENNSD